VSTLNTGCAERPAGMRSNVSVSGRPEQRTASNPSLVCSTSPPSARVRTIAGSATPAPVAGSVRVTVTRLPSVPSTSAAGLSRSALRFFSIVPPGSPVTIALTATMPSATPSKRTVDSPGGRVTWRVSVIIAKPCGQLRSISVSTLRLGSR
jgi:hypothetical protein